MGVAAPERKREFRILGPFEARENGRRLAIGAGKQRALLALLLLDAGEVVSAERLIDALWGESPPASALNSVHIYVSQLRKALGEGCLITRGRGYLLAVEREQLDLGRFERLLGEGRELLGKGEAGRASEALRAALGLWRGAPLADFASEPFARGEIARLEELRVAALEERIEADLALGRHAELVAELEALVRANPLRERLRALLMLALYRSGRQAEALEAYRQARATLIAELGLEPGRRLQELERAILSQDPSLEIAPEAGPTRLPAATLPKRTWVANRRVVAIAMAGLALAAALVAVALVRWTGHDFLADLDANALGVIDPKMAGIRSEVSLPGAPSAITAGGGFVWVVSEANATVSRVDPDDPGVVLTLSVGGRPAGVAYGGGSLWVTRPERRDVVQINPDTLAVVQTIGVGNGPAGVVAGSGAIWIANAIDGTVSRIGLDQGGVTETIPVGASPTGIAAGAGAVWVTDEANGIVLRIDPRARRAVQAIRVGNGPTAVTVDEGQLWVANRQDGTVSRIDPATGFVSATTQVGANPSSVAAARGAVWVASEGGEALARIDARTGQVDKNLSLGSSPHALVFAGGSVWVATLPPVSSHRGGVLRVESEPSECGCIDPALHSQIFSFTDQSVMTLVYDGLVAYRRVGGIAGGTLLGDLAVGVPAPTDNAREYTFLLRRNLRYSNGAPVRPSDFRYSVERALTVNRNNALRLYRDIVGAASCTARPTRRCDLRRGIEVDDAARRITIHLTEADPTFPHKLTSPLASVVPSGTPLRVPRGRPIPGTGPYRVARFRPTRFVRLVRNPHFRVWSRDARPDSYPNEIRFQLSVDPAATLAAVEKGKADWAAVIASALPARRVQALLTRHPGQLHNDPWPLAFWFFMNTQVPPFDDLRVRQALNYAIDRGRIVRFAGGRLRWRVSCQILPPGFPGYRPYCPYTRGRNGAGSWIAPDRRKARALVAASGTRGMRVTVVSYQTVTGAPLRTSRYLVSLLRDLGYRSSLRVLSDIDPYVQYVGEPRNRAQIGLIGWLAETLAPSEFLRRFGCAAFLPKFLPTTPATRDPSRFCDRRIDSRMRRAVSLSSTDSTRANELWADIDHTLVDRAAAVPLNSGLNLVLVSERVGNYQNHPVWGTLLDQMWVR
jgi:YVTN family beta-propeller protein